MMPAASARPTEEPSGGLRQPAPQRLGLDEVGERSLAVDLDDRNRLAIPLFELWLAADVDRFERAPTDLGDDLERSRAEVAAVGVVDDDPGQG
jgi:hypothetical protein